MDFITNYKLEYENFSEVFMNNKIVHLLKNDDRATDVYIRELAQKVGIPLLYNEDPITAKLIPNHWSEIKYDPKSAQSSYKHSNKSQPLHTDYCYFPFEIYGSFLYCLEQANFGGATTFIDVDTIVQILQQINPDLFDAVQQTKIQFGRKGNPIAFNEDYILMKDEKGWRISWNYFRAQDDLKNRNLIEDFKDFLDIYIEKSGELIEIKLQPGEGVFWHDRRVLHGRNSFLGNRQLNKGGIALSVPKELIRMLEK